MGSREGVDAKDRMAIGRRASLVGVACNVVLVLLKGVAGIMAGSVSVIADAANNLMDIASSLVSLIGFKLASKPADEGHPYGHGRFEYLAGLTIAVFVIVTGVNLIRSSVEKVVHPVPTNFTAFTLVALVFSLVTKLFLARYYRNASAAIQSDALRAASRDSLNDVLATGAVLAGAALSLFAQIPTDGPMGIVVGLFVLWSGIDLLRDTVNPLVGSMPDPKQVERVRQRILSYPGVLGTHDLLIHDYGPGHQFASAHVEMSAEEDPIKTHATIDQIERDLREAEGLATILHYDPVVTKGAHAHDLREKVADAVSQIDARLSVHDVSVEHASDGQDIVSFDCVVPEGPAYNEDELKERLTQAVQDVLGNVRCHITIDTGFVSPSR